MVMRFCAAALGVVLATGVAHAGSRSAYPAPGGARRAQQAQPAASAADRDEVVRARIQQTLELTNDQTTRLETILRNAHQEKNDAMDQLFQAHRALSELVDRNASDAEVRAGLDRLVEAKRVSARAGESYDEILALLGPQKTAKFALMYARFLVQRRSTQPGWRGSADTRWRGGDHGPTW